METLPGINLNTGENTSPSVPFHLQAPVAKQIGAELVQGFICFNRGATTVFLDFHKNNFTRSNSNFKHLSDLKIPKSPIF